MRVSNDKQAQVAADAQAELGWEMTPSEAREQLDFAAGLHIDEWLSTGRTEQFAWE